MKKNKKQAMSLLSILAMMMVVMVAIIVSTPIITKRLASRVTNSSESEATINGYFLCYKDAYENLYQITADVASSSVIGPKKVDECVFDFSNINTATSYTLTLIGGGGGGAATNVESTTATLAEDSIDFALNKVVLTPFKTYTKNYTKYITATTIQTGLKELFKTLNVQLFIEGARPAGKNEIAGGPGAICGVSLGNLYKELQNSKPISHITYTSGSVTQTDKGRGEDGYLQIFAGSTELYKITASGGGAPFSSNDYCPGGASICSYSDCYEDKTCKNNNICKPDNNNICQCDLFTYVQNTGAGNCMDNNSTCGSDICPTTTKKALNTYSTSAIAGDMPYVKIGSTITTRIPLKLTYNTLNGYVAQNGGDAGAITTVQVAFLAPSNETKITIPKSNIGNGGAGGKSDCSSSNTHGCDGEAGTDTTITINSVGGASNTYTAKGGTGATVEIKKLDYDNVSTTNAIAGIDGATSTFTLPTILTSNLQDASGGKGGSAGKYSGSYANYPGSGGGSAGISYRLEKGTDLQLTTPLSYTFAYPSSVTVKKEYSTGIGGKGAGGAILIEW